LTSDVHFSIDLLRLSYDPVGSHFMSFEKDATLRWIPGTAAARSPIVIGFAAQPKCGSSKGLMIRLKRWMIVIVEAVAEKLVVPLQKNFIPGSLNQTDGARINSLRFSWSIN
jgi:hypothetical protein